MTKYDAINNRRLIRRRAWGLLLLALWLSLASVACAQADDAAPAAPVAITDVHYAIDFNYLQQALPESVAWLYQPNGAVNHPVMYSPDSSYYLKRHFSGRRDHNGSIFMTGGIWPDFSAPVTTLYGRNCLDNSLLGCLSLYREREYFLEHPRFILLTPEGGYQLDVFAGIRSRLDDNTSWRVDAASTEELYTDYLSDILKESFLTPSVSALPTKDDSWAILANASPEPEGSRYVIYLRKRPIEYQTTQLTYLNQMEMDSRETQNGYQSVEGVGRWMIYAQNDPVWNRLIFEIPTSSRQRPFGDGGCGPTAVAMAVVNLVDKEELPRLASYAASPLGYQFCSCSVNDSFCSQTHVSYQLSTPDEFFRYFPVAVGNFATGNNIWGVRGREDRFGTSMAYLEELCSVYDISVTQTYDMAEALEFLKQKDTLAVACTTGYSSPFTTTSHFIVLAGVDDEYLYALDPYRREDYETVDPRGVLEMLAPNVVRIKLENAGACSIAPVYLLKRQPAQADQ